MTSKAGMKIASVAVMLLSLGTILSMGGCPFGVIAEAGIIMYGAISLAVVTLGILSWVFFHMDDTVYLVVTGEAWTILSLTSLVYHLFHIPPEASTAVTWWPSALLYTIAYFAVTAYTYLYAEENRLW